MSGRLVFASRDLFVPCNVCGEHTADSRRLRGHIRAQHGMQGPDQKASLTSGRKQTDREKGKAVENKHTSCHISHLIPNDRIHHRRVFVVHSRRVQR